MTGEDLGRLVYSALIEAGYANNSTSITEEQRQAIRDTYDNVLGEEAKERYRLAGWILGMALQTPGILTGSRVYGTPREDSDVDLVVPIDYGDMMRLKELADNGSGDDVEEYVPASAQLRFGRLNLLLVTNIRDFDVWDKGTAFLKSRAPVTRQQAVSLFGLMRNAANDGKDLSAEEAWKQLYGDAIHPIALTAELPLYEG